MPKSEEAPKTRIGIGASRSIYFPTYFPHLGGKKSTKSKRLAEVPKTSRFPVLLVPSEFCKVPGQNYSRSPGTYQANQN